MNKNESLNSPEKLTEENLKSVNSFDDLLNLRFGRKGMELRDEFDAKVEAFLLAERLKELRNQAKLTQQALADKTGLKKSFISRIENGKVDIQLSTFLRILNGLGGKIQIV
jgi:HTH-type transcriptional regulator/antitoxin HipB